MSPPPHTDVDMRLPHEGNSSEAAGNPLDALTWPVRTGRLTLRPATRDDLEATWRFRRLDDVSRWVTRATGHPGGVPHQLRGRRQSRDDPHC